MKIYISGTTRGLGNALFDTLVNAGHDVIGLNRPDFDMAKGLSNYLKNDFDVFIINAHFRWKQVDLLYKLFELNKERLCQIITIGSVSADGDRKQVNSYAIEKKALDATCTQLQLVPSRCILTNVKLGRMETDMVANKKVAKMKPEMVAEFIMKILTQNESKLYVKSITIDLKHENY